MSSSRGVTGTESRRSWRVAPPRAWPRPYDTHNHRRVTALQYQRVEGWTAADSTECQESAVAVPPIVRLRN